MTPTQPKILLINPPYSLEDRYGKNMKHFGGHAEPLGLAYLAAAVRQDGPDVEILDAPVLDYTIEMIAEKVKKERIRIAGISILTPSYSPAKATAQAIKKASPDTVVVLGGAHATILPEETLRDIGNDIVVIGEGENTLRELTRAILQNGDLRQVPGLAFLDNGRIIRTAPREFEKDIDKFPPPARDLLPMNRYFLTATRVKGKGFCGTVIVARGCPFNCAFCSHTFGRTFRAHSPGRIVSEIQDLIDKYGASEINLEADILTLQKPFLMALCDEIINKGLHKKIKWTCESRADTLSLEGLKKMKEAGCWQISLGIESGVDRLLKELGKNETTEQIRKAARMIRDAGITIRGFFMLGVPTETREESLKTIEFAKELDPDWAQFTVTIPFPGTPMFEKLKASGEIGSFNWDEYRTWAGWKGSQLPWVTQGRSSEEMHYLQKYAMRSFYLRPKMFFRFLRKVNSWKVFKKYLAGLFILLKIRKNY